MSVLFLSCKEKKIDISSFNNDVYTPEYSSNFKIQEDENGNALITVLNPWQGSSDVSSYFLIERNGENIALFKGETMKEGQSIHGEAKRIVCMSSTHIAMLEALHATDKIVAVSGKEYITNPKIANSNDIPDIGYEGNIDYEALMAVKPDLILLFSINGASSMEPKLKELGIPFLYVGDYVEETPLGKAEWIIPVAEVVGKREEGINKFNEIAIKYNTLKAKVKNKDLKEPKVMLNAPFTGAWFMPSVESYVARMVKDAGGDYIYKKNTGNSSQPIDSEEALKLLSQADFWLNTGACASIDELSVLCHQYMNVDCVKEGKVYNNNKIRSAGGGNDCYESGVVNPDLILRDMIKIFHPELIDEEFTYYQHLK